MVVPMMSIRKVRMGVRHGFMAVPMRVLPLTGNSMVVRVVCIVRVQVLVLQKLMLVRMGVVFSQVQPDTQCHQTGGCEQLPGQGFRKNDK